MKPILMDSKKTLDVLANDKTNGLGRLNDCVELLVTEHLNGQYTATMKYPVSGIHFNEIELQGIIKLSANQFDEPQLFRIVNVSKPLNGIVEYELNHITYDLSYTSVAPFTSDYVRPTLVALWDNMTGGKSFSISTDTNDSTHRTHKFKNEKPQSCRALFGGQEGSLIDIFGGEYHYDNLKVELLDKRGADHGVKIKYGKNLTDITQDETNENVYTHVIPYAQDSNKNTIIGDTITLFNVEESKMRILNLDLSDKFQGENGEETKITVKDVNREARYYVGRNNLTEPRVSLDVSFLDLSQTVEYANIAPLETVSLGDTVYVDYPTLGVSAKARVIEYEWDSLRERYNSVEIGDAKARLSTTIAEIDSKSDSYYSDLFDQAANNKTFLQSAIEHASELIKGAYGGHIVIGTNADGQPNEIYAMDTDDVSTAKKVLRINMNGIGGSTTGINGTYNVAILTEGTINADAITTGTLRAGLIKAGVLSDASGKNYWNMETGEISISSYAKKGEIRSQFALEDDSITISSGLITFKANTVAFEFGTSSTMSLKSNPSGNGVMFDGEGEFYAKSTNGLYLQNKYNSKEENHLALYRSNETSSAEMYNRFDNTISNAVDMEASKSLNQLSIRNYFVGALKSELYAYANSTENQVQLRCYDWESPSLTRSIIRARTTSDGNGDYSAIDLYLVGNDNSTLKAQVSLFNTAGGDGRVTIKGTDTVSIIGKNKIQFGTGSSYSEAYNYIDSAHICYWFNGVDYGKSIVTYAASGWEMHSIAFGWSGSALWAKVDQTQFKIYG
jgi:phage minor structural protein